MRPDDRVASPLTRRVWAALDAVMDPELDRSVAEMGFIERVAVDGDAVTIEFRLPTFWCAANFAYLMAWDMAAAVEALPGIAHARVRLLDHFAAPRINAGIAQRRRFEDVFGDEAGGGLDRLRRTFLEKAYLRRQLAVADELKVHASPARITDLDVGGLRDNGAAVGGELQGLIIRYLSLREAVLGRFGDHDPAFVTLGGEALPEHGLPEYWRTARRSLRSADANAEMCRIQLAARRSHPVPAAC